MISLMVKNNVITDYAKGSGLVGDNIVQYTGTIPDDFEENFKPSFYMLKDDEIVLNPDYVEPVNTPPNDGPTVSEQASAALTLAVAKQKEEQDKFNAQILLQVAKLGGTANV
ncbi:DUF2977 domain-containing protein [Pediococcus pentosaceus]|uniref:DUF2977 domain-containing protein n=1 Tax=Pediococcus pentosaceus TaxID=1255 RepID=UPI002380A04D|nr:DUF2977 domain-containing protein [Pediococcus pentosaceus]MDE3751887.1 DUF2977 domain-containing protein [Pediococcus pentosaceus]